MLNTFLFQCDFKKGTENTYISTKQYIKIKDLLPPPNSTLRLKTYYLHQTVH